MNQKNRHILDLFQTIYRLHNVPDKSPTTDIKMYGSDVRFIIDSGTNLNIISSSTYNKLKRKPKISYSSVNAYGLNASSPISIQGEFFLRLKANGASIKTRFIALDGDADNLLGFYAANNLGLFTINSIKVDGADECTMKPSLDSHEQGRFGKLRSYRRLKKKLRDASFCY